VGNSVLALAAWSVLFASFSGWLANEKGRSAAIWAVLGALFSLPALIALAGAPPLIRANVGAPLESGRPSSATQWACPKCSKQNENTSYKCSSCSYSLV
jgi:hypothetical protein